MLFAPGVAVIVPLQEPVRPFGLETTRPAGSGSVMPTPKSVASFAAGFVMVNVSDVEPFSGMLAAPNCFAIEGGATTSMLATAPAPKPPGTEETPLVTLFCIPAAVPMTLTLKLQPPDAGRIVLVPSWTEVPPSIAVIEPPAQEAVDRPLGVARSNPAGRLSVKPTMPREELEFGFERLNVSDVVAPRGMAARPKCLVSVGGAMTVIVGDVDSLPAPTPSALAVN